MYITQNNRKTRDVKKSKEEKNILFCPKAIYDVIKRTIVTQELLNIKNLKNVLSTRDIVGLGMIDGFIESFFELPADKWKDIQLSTLIQRLDTYWGSFRLAERPKVISTQDYVAHYFATSADLSKTYEILSQSTDFVTAMLLQIGAEDDSDPSDKGDLSSMCISEGRGIAAPTADEKQYSIVSHPTGYIVVMRPCFLSLFKDKNQTQVFFRDLLAAQYAIEPFEKVNEGRTYQQYLASF